MNKKAEMGMGTLIIFIAMVLVAAVAASVLITTTGSLQGKALDTGMSAKEEVGTHLQVLEIFGTDSAGSNGTLDVMNMSVKLSPGSEAVKVSDLLLLVNGEAKTFTAVDYAGSGITTIDSTDLAQLNFAVTDIGTSTSVDIQLIPKVGTSTVISARTPTSIPANSTVGVFP